ncbi:MAG: 30S ribosomal protein S17 [Patescibacteria group bacterium]
MKTKTDKIQRRTEKGEVVSDKMDKTIIVRVDRYASHPKYKKRYRITKKYFVDDPQKQAKMGDQVTIVETRPLSRHKRWKIQQIH